MQNAAAPSQSLGSMGALVNWPRYFKALVRLIARKRAFHNLCLPTQTVPKASPVCQHCLSASITQSSTGQGTLRSLFPGVIP